MKSRLLGPALSGADQQQLSAGKAELGLVFWGRKIGREPTQLLTKPLIDPKNHATPNLPIRQSMG